MNDAQRYREDGYLRLPGFFEPAEVELVHRDAQEVFARQLRRHGIGGELEAGMFELFERDLPVFTACGKHAQHLISLHRLSLDARILEQLGRLGLGSPSISTRPVLNFHHPRLATKDVYWRLGPHQDWRSMQGSLDSCVLWVPLVDIDRDLGALEVLPGSHRGGLRAAEMVDGYGHLEEEPDAQQMVPIEMERGDVLIFSTLLLHRSGTNATDSIRWSCHFRYNNLDEPTFIERGFPHPYVYRPQEELITPGFPSAEQVEALFGRPT